MRAARIAGLLAGAVLAVSAFCLAASADSVTLTPAQTVALYGTDISGTFLRQGDQSGNITFHYAYSLKSVGNLSQGGGFGGTTLDATVSYQQEIETLNGCVYIAHESDWGGGSFPTWRSVSSTQSPSDCNFDLKLSVDLGTYTDITQNIAWSTGTWSYVNEYYDYLESFPYYYSCPWECYHDFGGVGGTQLIGRGYAMRGGNPNYNWIASGLLTLYPWNGTDPVAENDQCTFAFSRVFMNNQTTGLTVNRMQFGIQTLQQVHKSAQFSPPTGDIWLIIFCPTITDHVPATTTTAATTRPPAETGYAPIGTAETGVDLDFIATDLAEIIRNQRHQIAQLDVENRNSRIIANNTAEMVEILNKIYEKMTQGGQIPIDGTFMRDVQNALTSYTTACIPTDAAAGLTFWAWLMGKIMEQAWIAELAALGSCLAVTYFILFRGRNS